MSRMYDDDEYESTRKGVEFFSEDIEDSQEDSQSEQNEEENCEYNDNVYELTEALKEYVKSRSIPLCQHLNSEFLLEFLS